MANIALLMQILLPLLDRASEITALLTRANVEKRDITESELNLLFADDDDARAALDAAISAARVKS